MFDIGYLLPFIGGALLIFIITLIDIRVGLGILIFVAVLTPKIIIGDVDKPIKLEDILLVIIILGWLTLTVTKGERFVKTPLNTPILLLLFFNFLSLINAFVFGNLSPAYGNPQDKVYSFLVFLKKVQYFLIFFLVVNVIKNLKYVKLYIFLLILGCVIVGIHAIISYVPHWHYVGEDPYRVAAPFTGESNTFGQYMFLHIILIIAMIFATKKLDLKIALIAALVVASFAFIFTYSRASYFGLLAALLTLIIISRNKTLLIAAIIGVVFINIIIPKSAIIRVQAGFREMREWYYEREKIYHGANTFKLRVDSFIEGFTLGIKKPLIGYGLGVFPLPRIEAQIPRDFLETGFIGLAIFFWILYIVVKTSWETAKATNNELIKWLCYTMISVTVGYMVSGFAALPFTTIITAIAFWFLCGLVMTCHKLVMQKKDKEEFVEFSYQKNKSYKLLIPNATKR